jgi:hypothetical protein
MLNIEQGKRLVGLARQAISSHIAQKTLRVREDIKREFSMKMGAFVTLEKNGILRGCIGVAEPVYPLYEAVVNSATGAAFSDPRFPPLDKEELGSITISVSVLTPPRAIDVRNPEEYIQHIRVGRDGLLVRGIFSSGLLLPIVAVEQKWDSLTFLQQTCLKAGLPPDTWQDFNACRVYKFQTEVFSEKSPNGEVIKEM